MLGAFSAVEGLSRCPRSAAAAGEGCICGVGVGGETVSADEGLKAGSNNTLSALLSCQRCFAKFYSARLLLWPSVN